jgi:predicted dehydrogenase
MGTAPVRVALLGCGRIAHVHCGYLRQTPDAICVGACDSDLAVRDRFAGRWQLPTYQDIDELIEAAAPDAIHVVTPPATHAPLACELLGRGLHVLVEKPMALSLAEGRQMVAAARAADRVLTVDHNRWFDPVVKSARALIDSGGLGELIGVDVFQGVAAEADETHWGWRLPGGPLWDLATHPIYLLHGLIGAVSDVQVSSTLGERGDVREIRAVLVGARAPGTLTISQATRPFNNRIVLYGSKMTAEVNLNNMTLITRQTRKVPKVVGKVLPNMEEAAQLVRATVINGIDFITGKQRYYPGMGVHIGELYAALARGEAPPVTAEDGLAVLGLAEEVWAKAGVDLRDFAAPQAEVA